MLSDLRFAIRQLAKSPVFATIAILSLALGIGASTAIFSLVNAVLLRSLPVKNPGELVLFRNIEGLRGRMSRAGENNSWIDPATGRDSSTSFSLLTFDRFKADHPALVDVLAYAPLNQINLLIDGRPESAVLGQYVSGNYYRCLGVQAILGRVLSPSDDLPSAGPAAVISYRYWEARFNRSPTILGKTIQLNRVAITVVGVTSPGFDGAMQVGESADITVPLALHPRIQTDRAENRLHPWYWWIRIMGRLSPGTSTSQARATLEPTFQQSAREGWLAGQSLNFSEGEIPELPTLAADPGGRGEDDRRRQYAQELKILMGLVGIVLLGSCANVANLLLARGAARRSEIAVRLALGASRLRVVRQLLTESVILAVTGTTLGVILAFWSRSLLLNMRQFGGAQAVLNQSLDWRVLAFTIAVAALTTALFGIAPALRATRGHLVAGFQGGSRVLSSAGRSRLAQSLTVVQLALSLVLLVGTGLFVRTLRNIEKIDPGFDTRHLVLFRVDATSAAYTPSEFVDLHRRLQERLEQIPGVSAATYSRVALLSVGRANRKISTPGPSLISGGTLGVDINGVAPNFFSAMGIPLQWGREFTIRDAATTPKVAVVNQEFARKVFGNENPIGAHFNFGATPTAGAADVEIVGLVRDAKYTSLRESVPPTIYLPAPQMLEGTANFAVRILGSPAPVISAIGLAIGEVAPTLPIVNLRTQEEQIERLSSQEQLFAHLSGFFGMAALALACVGLYGVISFSVLRRTGEIGLRIALGAVPGDIFRMILREAFVLVGIGILVGAAVALGAMRSVSNLLFGLSEYDPLTYLSSIVVLVVVAIVACLLPALRASRVQPMVALRTG